MKLGKEDVFNAVSLVTIAVTGSSSRRMRRGLFLAFHRMSMFVGEDNEQMASILSRPVNMVKKRGMGAQIHLIKEILGKDMKVTSLAVVADMAWWRGMS